MKIALGTGRCVLSWTFTGQSDARVRTARPLASSVASGAFFTRETYWPYSMWVTVLKAERAKR
jgi:hypothetical protein